MEDKNIKTSRASQTRDKIELMNILNQIIQRCMKVDTLE
jgi:hypothetical protein